MICIYQMNGFIAILKIVTINLNIAFNADIVKLSESASEAVRGAKTAHLEEYCQRSGILAEV